MSTLAVQKPLPQRRKSGFRTDFQDAPRWEELARAAGIRLPRWAAPCTPTAMERWLRRLSIPITRYYEWSGTTALRQFRAHNPDWPLAAWVGLLLEKKEEGKL